MEIRATMPQPAGRRHHVRREEPGPQPQDSVTLEGMCVRMGDKLAEWGPVRCGAVGLLVGLASAVATGSAEGLLLGPVGAWIGHDARQGQKAFQQGPDSKLWQKRLEHDGIGTSRPGANFLNSLVSGVAGGGTWLLTGSQGLGMIASVAAFFATRKALEHAGRAAEQRLISNPFQQ